MLFVETIFYTSAFLYWYNNINVLQANFIYFGPMPEYDHWSWPPGLLKRYQVA